MPQVSVCIPVYNPGPFLKAAIDSVLAQSFDDFELLIVDDASTQPVTALVTSYNDARLHFVQNMSNLGLVGNWNRCIELAAGEYITIFHQDDEMCRENLADKVAVLDRYPEVGIVYSDIVRVDEFSRVIGNHYIEQPNQDLIMSGTELYKMVAQTGNPVACPTVVVRRKCYTNVGMFDAHLPFATDLEMWLRIARIYSVAFCVKPLVAYRVHSKQETARFSGSGHDYLDILRALDIAFSADLAPEYATFRSQAYRTLAGQASAMARWKFRNRNWGASARYTSVAMLATYRSLRES